MMSVDGNGLESGFEGTLDNGAEEGIAVDLERSRGCDCTVECNGAGGYASCRAWFLGCVFCGKDWRGREEGVVVVGLYVLG